MKILLLSQEEPHPFYSGIHSYFTAPLLEPPALPLARLSSPPLGITLLASALKERGFEPVPLYNFFSRESEKLRLVAELRAAPFAACVSTTHLFSPGLLEALARLVKELSPRTVLVAGGPGAEWDPRLRPAEGWTVLGPGERELPDLLEALRGGRDPRGIPNLVRGGAATGRAEPPPLDGLPFPDWGLYPEPPAAVAVQGSRGCPRGCGFCSYNSPYSARSAASVLAEIKNNRDRWGIRNFRFTDSDFAGDRERALEICRGLEGGGSRWTCFARADSLHDGELAAAMRRAGCLWVFLGVESGSDRILAAMNKGCDAAGMRRGIASARAAGLGVHGNFVIGYPGETRETLRETVAFAKSAGLDTAYFSPFQIRSPGIPAAAGRQEGLTGGPEGWRHGTMSSEETLELTAAAMGELAGDPAAPLLTSEALFSLFSAGEGGDFGRNVREFFGAVRDWNAARRRGDAAGEKEARRTMGRHL